MFIYYFLINIKFLYKQNKLKKIFIFFFILFFKIAKWLVKNLSFLRVKVGKKSNNLINVLRAPYKNKLARLQFKTNYKVLVLTTNIDVDFFFFFLHLVYVKKKELLKVSVF